MSEPIPKEMNAVVYRGPGDLRLERIATPRPRADELLVRVAVCGVCPTDIKKIHHGLLPPPRIFGHETAGTVVHAGKRTKGFAPGDRVALHHHVPCLRCHACRHRAFAQCPVYKRTGVTAGFEPAGGGYAEYVRVMPFVFGGVVRIPPRNRFLEGALLEPVNTVLKAVHRLGLLPGDTALVAGQGPIGLMFTRLLRLNKVRVFATDLMAPRLDRARAFGATACARGDDPELASRVDRWTRGRGLDAAVIAVPSDAAVLQAQALIRGGGRLLLFAHTRRGEKFSIDLAEVCVDEKDFIGSYSSDVTLQEEAARLVFSRQLNAARLVSHRFPLERTDEAVALAARPQPDSLKIMVEVQPSAGRRAE